jgi:hypothetical protein
VLAVVVVVSLAVPAVARTREEQPAPQPKRPDLVQILKQWVVRAFGDGLTVPRP